jgi:putative addiction module component (TIGR02574 family)
MVDRNAEALAEQILAWPVTERARLASLLLASMEPSESDVDAAWDAEIVGRAAELDEGQVRAVSAADVFAELDRRLRA